VSASKCFPVGSPEYGKKVVEVQDNVHAGVLGAESGVTQRVIVGVLLVDLDGDPDGWHVAFSGSEVLNRDLRTTRRGSSAR
jgi:hypothetical protein